MNDGARAILTEYMLAGLSVLANAELACGLHYIQPATGRTAPAANFGAAIADMLADLSPFTPRQVFRHNWTWPQSVACLRPLIERARVARRVGYPR